MAKVPIFSHLRFPQAAKYSFQMAYRQNILSKRFTELKAKASGNGRGFLITVFSIAVGA
jgi:hypothetical protein